MTKNSSVLTGFITGFLVAIVLLVGGAFFYLRFGHPPVATADPSFPMEAQIVHVPLGARIQKELEPQPFQPIEASYVEGAKVYAAQCASCHGIPNHEVAFAKWMFPSTPALWKSHRAGVVGVSDDESGETYWKVKNGIRLSGMPAFSHVLSTEQMWDVSLLLKNANNPQSPAVMQILSASQLPQ